MSEANQRFSFYSSLLSGAAAGVTVDVCLFPIDTVKTRLQAPGGFWRAGGFRGVYSGLGPVVLGSAPTAALFFCTYDSFKHLLTTNSSPAFHPIVHSASASFGEVVACLVRVPVEVVKQRAQSSTLKPWNIFRETLKQEGVSGFYRGYTSTVIREVPFSFIQFPIWEELKRRFGRATGRPVEPHEGAICGAIAGGISAAVTTPIDVAKTRIILAKSGTAEARGRIGEALAIVYRENGVKSLFAGGIPRVTHITIGGFLFFGAYEFVVSFLKNRDKSYNNSSGSTL